MHSPLHESFTITPHLSPHNHPPGELPFIISESEQGPLCPTECPRERHRPVCASNGKLYRSHCVFQRARCQEPLLQALPRFRCGEDRAAALARHQVDSIYVPECDEDGSFLQVQCHRQTGYCWCATAEGKPVSGTSVLNQTPNCTGTWQPPQTSVIVAFELFSSLNAEGGRPRATPASPPPQKQEGKRPPSPDCHSSGQHMPEFPPSCEQERLEALEEIQQHQQEGTFVPECEGDDTYKPIQCHQATGYCWCVQANTGRPVPGTSTRSVSNCESDAAAKSAEMGSLFRDRALPGGEGAWGKTNGLALAGDGVSASRRLSDRTPGPSLEERAARWHFVRLDKDFSDGLSEQELRPLKLYVKQHTRPKRCARKFLEYCDLDANRLVSLPELRGCLGLKPGRLGSIPSSRRGMRSRN
uniref:SPARC related modular calcium binding 1 n=1 Tax=Chelonoidis abingdonii TaxID=106734 RepID=A0A8C0GPM0_CHEAB